MRKSAKYSPEVRERAVRMVFEHQSEHGSQWAVMLSISAKIGCTGETLRRWVRQAKRDQGKRSGPTTSDLERVTQLERESRELRQANEILRKASAYFAQAELDRRFKPSRRAQGMTTTAGREHPRGALHGGTADAATGTAWRGARRQIAKTTISNKATPCLLDQVNRQLQADRPNALWVSDFKYVSTWQGFVYVAFVIEVFA